MTYNMSNTVEYDPCHPGFELLFDECDEAVGGLLQSELEAAKTTTTSTIQTTIGSYAPAASSDEHHQQQQQPQQGKKRKQAPSCEKKATKRKPAAAAAAAESSRKRPDARSYEELSECVVALGSSVDRLAGRSWPDIENLRGDVDRAENLLASAKSQLEMRMRELACVLCRRSPTERPLIVRGQCGHSFCCQSCLGKYVADRQGSFKCLRCDATGPVTLLQL